MDQQVNFKFWALFATIYLSVCATAYLHGYWSQFNIDIFTYMPLVDIIKYAISPLLFFFPIAVLILITISILPDKSKNGISPIQMVLCVIFSAGFFIVGFIKEINLIAYGLPTVFICSIILINYFNNYSLRISVSLLILLLLAFGISDYGKKRAFNIKNNLAYLYISDAPEGNRLKYLGYINGQYFFSNELNTKIVIKMSPSELSLTQYIKK